MSARSPFVAAGIQARMSSSRLPGKVLADLAGQPLIRRVWQRVAAAATVDAAVVLTSTDPTDDPLAEYLDGAAIPYRRGPLDDVLARFVSLAEEFRATHVVRVTGDCPLVAPEYIDLQVRALLEHGADLTRPARPELAGPLVGQGAMSVRVLTAANQSTAPEDREHVGSFFIARNSASFETVLTEPGPELLRADVRICVDVKPDLDLVRAIYEHFAPKYGSAVPLAEVLAWLDVHPELRASNAGVQESAANLAVRELERRNAARTS